MGVAQPLVTQLSSQARQLWQVWPGAGGEWWPTVTTGVARHHPLSHALTWAAQLPHTDTLQPIQCSSVTFNLRAELMMLDDAGRQQLSHPFILQTRFVDVGFIQTMEMHSNQLITRVT